MQILQNEKRNQGQNWVKYIMGIIKHMSQKRTDNVMPPPPPQKKPTTNQTKVHVSKHIIKCPVRKISRIRHDIIVPKIQRMLATNFGNNSVLKLSVRPIRK